MQLLLKFLEKLKTSKDKPQKRVKKKLYDSIFRKGDCLTYLMDNGNYGGAFVFRFITKTISEFDKQNVQKQLIHNCQNLAIRSLRDDK